MNFFFFGAIPHHEKRRTGNAHKTEVDGKRIMASFLHRSPIGEKEKGGKEEQQPLSRGEYRSSLKDRIRQKTFFLSHILDYRVLVSFFFLFFLCYIKRMMFFDEK